MKIIGMVLIFISCSGIGLTFTYIYKKRLEELSEWRKGIALIKNEINFALTPLPEAFEIVAGRLEKEINIFFKGLGKLLQSSQNNSLENLDDNIIKKMLVDTCLNEKDKVLIVGFIKRLGLLDKESQINNLALHINNMDQEIEKLKKDEEKNNKLYKTLGILSGIFIIVIFL